MFIRTESFKEFRQLYPVVTWIVAIHLILYIITLLPFIESSLLFEKLIGVNLYIAQGEYWRLVTPIFIHSGLAHTLFNSFSLVLFGPSLERILGKGRFILLYLAAGILANVATLILKPLTYIHVGSSGAIFGLFGAYLALILFRKDIMSRENSQIVVTIAVIGLIMTFIQPNINVTAHLFGLLAGFLVGTVIIGRGRELRYTLKSVSTKAIRRSANKGRFSPKMLIWLGIALLAIIGLISR